MGDDVNNGQGQDLNNQNQDTQNNSGDAVNNQQNKIDTSLLFQRAYNEGRAKAEKDLDKQLQEHGLSKTELAELAELKRKQAELEDEKLIKKNDFEAILSKKEKSYQEQIAVRESKIKEYESGMNKLLVGNSILASANKHEAYDSQDIESNLSRLFDFQVDAKTMQVSILRKDGSIAINKETGEPMTIDDAVLMLKSMPEKKHLFKARNVNGAGITGSGNLTFDSALSMSGEQIAKDPVAYINAIMKNGK